MGNYFGIDYVLNPEQSYRQMGSGYAVHKTTPAHCDKLYFSNERHRIFCGNTHEISS